MSRRSRSRRHPVEALPGFVGLIVLLVYFGPPEWRQRLKVALFVVLGLGFLTAFVFVVWAVLKRRRKVELDWFGSSASTAPTSARPVLLKPEPQTWNLALLRELEWKRFEDVVAAYFRWEGLRAKTTRIGPDGGIDVYLYRDGESAPLAVVQCKAWTAYKVGIKPVRELLGVMASEKIAKGYFITTGTFTEEAREFGQRNPLELIDGHELLRRIQALPEGARHQLLMAATKGDYTTPSCPRCGLKMVRRVARSGSNPGSEFWGCPTYPRCNGKMKLGSAASEGTRAY